MTTLKEIKNRMDLNDCISISMLNKKYRQFLRLLFVLLICSHISLFILYLDSKLVIGVAILTLLAALLLIRKLYFSLASASLKGDALILKDINNKSLVASIKSINNIKTKKFGAIYLTALNFKIDGTSRKAMLISDKKSKIQPSDAILSAQHYLKNKRQIYKPGSVS